MKRSLATLSSTLLLPLVLLLQVAGCADTLRARDAGLDDDSFGEGGAPAGGPNIPARSGAFTHTVLSDGSVLSTVDATDYEEWQRLDLDSGYARVDGWDLAFRRFFVLSNGGASGGGGVRTIRLPGVAFDDVVEAPDDDAAWTVDQPDGDVDTDSVNDSVFNDGVNDWYDYALSSHELTPRDVTYVVVSTEGYFYKLRLEDYYDDVGTSGVLTFRWARLPGGVEPPPQTGGPTEPGGPTDPEEPEEPEEPDEDLIAVDATSYESWVYLKLGSGVVSISQPTSSTGWDLAVRRFAFMTNSGTSGPGQGGAKLDESGLHYDELQSISSDGFVVDSILPASEMPGSIESSGSTVLESWYDYPSIGTLIPKEQTYLLRAASGAAYGKLRIRSYRGGRYELSLDPVSATP